MSVLVFGSYAKALVMTAARIPTIGETLLGKDFRQTFGGKGSDMAVQAARLGCATEFVGVVGDDAFGHEFIALMKAEGIGIAGLRVTGEQPTGAGFIIKDEAARNIIVVDMGANALFGRADVDRALGGLAAPKVALAQLEIPLDTALYGLSAARAKGATAILNPAPALPLIGQDLSMVDILTPNETEARVALGLSPDDPRDNAEIAAELMKTGCGAVVMTRGEDGVLVHDGQKTLTLPAFKVDHVDSNGAGDSFNAALAVALAEGRALPDAARFASAVAALCCTRWETVPSYHTRAEVERFLKESA
ncbi:ribokinase [Consotaella salsifontis]|uniref:Ribokinase n=1 Tax=Consotaella salsifontis TaxID=1365950 RepID=A0A1T4S742_9HYPH|nr:ribokinase [Consotaella salsifontis]SKA24140.1 ribokinase [Consotaella salsifontis]